MFKNKLLKLHLSLIVIFTLIGFSPTSNAETPETVEPDSYVKISVFTNTENVTGGETIRLGIEQIIHPNWHTYWLNPGDSGLAFSIEWNLPEDYSISALEWPAPQKISYGELTNYGYEGEVTLLQSLTIPSHISSEPITITGKVNLLVCHDICIPETHKVKLNLNSEASFNSAKIKAAESKLPTYLDQTANFYEQGDNLIIDIQIEDTTFETGDAYITPEEWGLVNNNATAVIEKINTGFRITQKRGERSLLEISTLPFVMVSANKDKALRFTATASQNESAVITAPPTTNNKSPITFIKAIILALLGGLILNLMPCVFPVLSMKALSLVQLGDKDERKARLYGLSYTAGIMISFAIIAAILITLKAAGAQIGWGFQLQNPIVISLLAYLVFIIGLNLTGFFEFALRFGNAGQNLADKSGNKGAFFTGVLATLVATPCTAPFMGAAMGYALTQGAFISIIIFLALGFGLALPYLALCFIPALRTKLPKPGAWMETFKQFLSFPMFLTAAFLIWVLSHQANSISVLLILSAMVAITFVIWLWQVKPKKGLARFLSFTIMGVLVAFIICTPLMMKTNQNIEEALEQNEQAFTNQKLTALLKGDDPIFTNMTAAWCITCKINERIALKTTSTKNLFSELNIQYLKGDWTNRNAEISQYLNSFDRQGVPLYVYYGERDKKTGQRPEPAILPQVLTTGIVKDTIQSNGVE